jgi:hypothetical protein
MADCGRVIVGGALPLGGVILLAATLLTIASLQWVQLSVTTPTDAYGRAWAAVTTAKAGIKIFAIAAEALCVTVISLKILVGTSWAEILRSRRLSLGLASVACISLLTYWPSLLAPTAQLLWPTLYSDTPMLGLAGLIGYFGVLISVGVAVPVAVSDEVNPAAAFARAFRLLAKLRWRIGAIGIAYIVSVGLCAAPIMWGLAHAGVGYLTPGWGLASTNATLLLPGALSEIAIVSTFLQARRIADGPSETELQEVFA